MTTTTWMMMKRGVAGVGLRAAMSRLPGPSSTAVAQRLLLHSSAITRFEKSTPTKNSATTADETIAPPPFYPQKSKTAGSHHWSIERVLSIATIPLLTSAIFTSHPSFLVDVALGVVIPLHTHIGFDACITDYLHERKYGVLHMLAKGALYVATALTVYGALLFNFKDVGITTFVKGLWTGKPIEKK